MKSDYYIDYPLSDAVAELVIAYAGDPIAKDEKTRSRVYKLEDDFYLATKTEVWQLKLVGGIKEEKRFIDNYWE